MAEKVDYAALKKGGFMRQKQKGCFSLRLAVVGGNLTAENIKTVAEVAEKYGHGYVHMTSRQGIEIPFIKVEDINEVKEELAKGGVGTGVCGPRVRTITACQGAAICPSGCIDTYTLAKELDARYFGRELPHKFKFGVTGCQNNCLKAEENDVGIKGGMTVECNHDDCIQCGVCVKACREGALRMEDGKIVIDREKCNNCARCGSESRGISFPLVDYLEIRFIKVNRLFRSSVIKKLFSESQMRLFHFLKSMQMQVSVFD